MKIKTRRITNKDLIMLVVYKIILDCVYGFLHANLYSYYGFTLDVDYGKLLFGWVLFLFVARYIKNKKSTVSSVFILVLFMLSFAPCLVYYQFNPEGKDWMMIIQATVILIMDMAFKSSERKQAHFRNVGVSYKNETFRFVVILFLACYLVIMFYKFGIPKLSSMSVTKISETRSEVKIGTLLSIIQNIICKILCPVFLLISIKERKPWLFVLMVFVQVYTYGITGFKTFLFIPVLVIGIGLFKNINLRDCILYGLPLIIVVVSLLYVIIPKESTLYIYALSVERVIFLPAKIKVAYFDYFSTHDFVMFAQSTIGKLFGIPNSYPTEIPYLIGEVYFNRPEMWTNTGFIADAYANGGVIGVALMSLVVYYGVKIANDLVKNSTDYLNKSMQVVFLLFFISLNDGGAMSVMFSGGMIFAIISLILIDFSDQNATLSTQARVRLQRVKV